MILNIDFFVDTLIYSFIPLGLWISMRIMKYPDLAIEQVFVMGGGIFAIATQNNIQIFWILFLLLAFATTMGFVNSLLRFKLKINAIILSLIMSYCYYSLSLYCMGKPNLSVSNYYDFIDSKALLIIILVLLTIIVLAFHFFLKSNIGNKVIATGCNDSLSKGLGMKTMLLGGIGLSISYTVILIGGMLYSMKLRNADISYGNGYLLMAIFIVLITRILDKRINFIRNALIIITATCIYCIILQTIISLNFPTELTRGFYALMLLLLVILAPKNEIKLL
jgi:putative ABC transport system permease protein